MKTKQTARKSTSQPTRSGKPPSADPIQKKMQILLETKRKSATPGAKSDSSIQLDARQLHHIGTSLYNMGLGPSGKRIPTSDNIVKVPPKNDAILKDIRNLQSSTQLIIPRAPFHRLVRDVAISINSEIGASLKFQTAALEAIQEAAESYLVRLMEDSYLCTVHAKRVTLFIQDMHLCRRLQNREGFKL